MEVIISSSVITPSTIDPGPTLLALERDITTWYKARAGLFVESRRWRLIQGLEWITSMAVFRKLRTLCGSVHPVVRCTGKHRPLENQLPTV